LPIEMLWLWWGVMF